ncbi:serine threonine- kinase fnkB [Fusarium albosuccineum]|uniref:Serine threonine- kinase fnkB n=1 Tax=Fusarium albosuccineum TaxID=1237068 RepID=A0A8H4L255_9HYPO|nr:serine threonine- kinase fnkB [Fusarium albosuccineum]
MAPVMMVNFKTTLGSDTQAILKLYDRRFGTHLRISDGKYAPCKTADEDAYQSFLRQGKMEPFIHELEEENRNSLIPLSACDFNDGSPDGTARYEAALWYEANEHFNNESQAYAQLADLQGTSIPRVYAHVRLASPRCNSEALQNQLQPDTENYLDVNGVLMETITGCSLWDLPNSAAAPEDEGKWSTIIQQAVDAAHEINKRGLLLEDSGPRNVMINQSSQKPFIVDFAQCHFKDKLFRLWEEISLDGEEGDEDEWNLEIEYWMRVRSSNNPASIGLVMGMRLLKTNGMKVDVNYPDYEAIISNLKRQLADEKSLALIGTKA